MPLVVTDLVQSKKFVLTLTLTLGILVAGYLGVLTKPEVLALLGVLWPVYLGAQGIADVGQKIADGHVTVKEMAGQQQATKDAQTSSMLETMTPLITQLLSAMPGRPPPAPPAPPSAASRLRALTKGDRVIRLWDPTAEGVVLDAYIPEASPEDPPCAVRCRFAGVEVSVDRFAITYVPEGTVLPSKPPAVPDLKKS